MGGMTTYIGRRLILSVVTIVALSALVFWILQLAPGGPLDYFFMTNPYMSRNPVYVETMMERMGLDKPVEVQYLNWLSGFLVGDWGWSFTTGQRVTNMIGFLIPPTVALGFSAIIIALLVAIPIGVISALKQYSKIDSASLLFALVGLSMPSFWLGIMLLFIFGLRFDMFPVSGIQTLGVTFANPWDAFVDQVQHLVLPVTALSITQLAITTRLVRSSMLDALKQDYIVTARAKGLSERVVVFKHALRNALLPVVTMTGLSISFMLAGSTLIETVFSRPGLGRLIVEATNSRDYPLIMGTTMLIAIMVVVGNLITDISYALLDPRIKYE
jgi:peptide/nickel transport system permease protein